MKILELEVKCGTDSTNCDNCICEKNCESYKIKLLQAIIECTVIERPEYISMKVDYLL